MDISSYIKIYPCSDAPDKVLVYSTARGSMVRLDRHVMDEAWSRILPGHDQQTLASVGILVPDWYEEREQIRTIFDQANRQASTYTALVTLNLDCNLACGYCYEENFRGSHYMSLETAELLVEHLGKQIDNGMNLALDFYGGEALLSLPLMKYIASRLRTMAMEAGVSASFNLVSNGTLLMRPVAEELKELGFVNVRLTIDGPPEIHDRQRPYLSRKGSFNHILKNLDQACDLLSVQLGGNFTKDNYRQFPQLLDILLECGITPDRLGTVLFSPITPKTGDTGLGDFATGCACPNEPWLVEASLYLRQEVLRRGFKAPKPKLTSCMVEFENDLVVNYDGSLYKCPAFMGWEDLQIGTLSQGINDYRESHNLDVWKNKECLDCAYLPLCFGGCRFLRRLRTGSIDGVDCRREFLDAALEQILMQDLAFGKASQPIKKQSTVYFTPAASL